jgi:hypothetical protein
MAEIDYLLALQFGVGLDHGGGINRKLLREIANGRKLMAGFERARGNVILDLVYHLAINRQARVGIDVKMQIHELLLYGNNRTVFVNPYS